MEPPHRVLEWIILFWCLIWLVSNHSAAEAERRLVCYYANWSIYRPGLAKFTPDNINPFLCTHLIYAFAGMNKDYELKPFDSYNDLQLGNYKKFTNLKTYNPKLKVMIAVGGWNEGSKRFSKMVESSASRLRFVRGAVSFLRKHGFDGLDLDWEYPGSRDGGRDQDKEGYRKLVEELREAFDSESAAASRLLLTMAVPAGKQYIDKGYDVPALSRHLDFLNLLTYDYHTSQEAQVNHHAPLREEPGLEEWNPNKQLNVEWTVRYYVDLGCDRSKLVLGIPTYGRSFTLAEEDETELGAPAVGPGEKGNATREPGYLAYYEICQMIQEQEWELEAPHPQLMGPYAYAGNQWVGFDDEDIILEKVKFIAREKLGGGMVWTLDNDDFRGKCYGEQSPLIATLKSALEEGDALLASASPEKTSSSAATTQRTARQQRPTQAPRAFTTPDPGPPFECEEEGFYNNPTDCKKYFWCLDSGPSNLGLVAHSFTCPSGLHFNKQRDSCDYAANVVCRAKKKTTTTAGTTARPRQRPRPKKTSTTTTTTEASVRNDLEAPETDAKEGLAELLELIQQLGLNKIHERLSKGGESSVDGSTASPTLPEYRVVDRRKASTAPPAADLFLQYARPDRTAGDGPVAPRGPQFHHLSAASEEEEEDDDSEEDRKPEGGEGGVDFPFVYHTPSRHRSKTPADDDEAKVTTAAASSKATAKPHRRVVVRVRPMSGENSGETETQRNRYVLAQTVGVGQQVRPNALEERTTTFPPSPPKRRARPRKTSTVSTSSSATDPPRYRGLPPRKELIILPTGKPAVPATTRRYRPALPEVRGPALAQLADGGVTCLRRGVHPHPKECTKFIVCVPSEGAEDLDGFIHSCPENAYFMEDKGRCLPGDCSNKT